MRRLTQSAVSPLASALGGVLASALGATRADKESAAFKEGTADILTLPKALDPSAFSVVGKNSSKDGGSISILRAMRESRDAVNDPKDGGSHGKRFGSFPAIFNFGTPPATTLPSLREDEADLEAQADELHAMCPICARSSTSCTCTCSADDSDTPEWIKEGERDVGLATKSHCGEVGGEIKGEVGNGGVKEEPSAEQTRPSRRRSTSPDVLDSSAIRETATQTMGATRRKRTVTFDLGTSAVRVLSNLELSRADDRPASSSERSKQESPDVRSGSVGFDFSLRPPPPPSPPPPRLRPSSPQQLQLPPNCPEASSAEGGEAMLMIVSFFFKMENH